MNINYEFVGDNEEGDVVIEWSAQGQSVKVNHAVPVDSDNVPLTGAEMDEWLREAARGVMPLLKRRGSQSKAARDQLRGKSGRVDNV